MTVDQLEALSTIRDAVNSLANCDRAIERDDEKIARVQDLRHSHLGERAQFAHAMAGAVREARSRGIPWAKIESATRRSRQYLDRLLREGS